MKETVDVVVPIAMDKNSVFSVRERRGDVKGPVSVKRTLVPASNRGLSPKDLRTFVTAKAFAALGEDNPLRKMPEKDRELAWGALMIFSLSRENPRKGQNLQKLEHLAQVVSDAARLSVEIRELLRNDYGEVLNRRLTASQSLPAQLDSFMIQVGSLLYLTGFKKQQRVFNDYPLIYVSELVRLRTGTWNDEHLAELLQTMRSEGEDFSGDAIRKRRERFKTDYPLVYRLTVERALKGEPLIRRPKPVRARS